MNIAQIAQLESLQKQYAANGLYRPEQDHDACGVGIIANVDGTRTHDILAKAREILVNLSHRGACGCDNLTGDGAGIIFQMPDEFFQKKSVSLGFDLPPYSKYGVAMTFFPNDEEQCKQCMELFKQQVRDMGLGWIGYRDVPVAPEFIGEIARRSMPIIRQIFLKRPEDMLRDEFERKLFLTRRMTAKAVEASTLSKRTDFYICSFSYKTITYKGLLISEQIDKFFPDLLDPSVKSALALVHRRFSTNTLPSWPLAQPFRYMCHNGEINAIRGNRNWLNTREPTLESELFGPELNKAFPILLARASDSQSVDNMVELMALGGRSLEHVFKTIIPEAWENEESLTDEVRAFYEYHSILSEPWDGPALIACTDGHSIGLLLDRNGLRPARYTITKQGFVVAASETGVLKIDPEDIEHRGRIAPGQILLVNTEEGRIHFDEDIKRELAKRHPYRKWIKENVVEFGQLPAPKPNGAQMEYASLRQRQKAHGYTLDDQKFVLRPMIDTGQEAVGSMGNDTALAVMAERPQLLFNYFKQLFAQVTNPPIDPIREKLVMSLEHLMGMKPNLLLDELTTNEYLRIERPVLTLEELAKIRALDKPTLKPITLPILFDVTQGEKGLEQALENLFRRASAAISEGFTILILSDRGIDQDHAPIPSLLAISALHHQLLREQSRTKVSFVLETAEPREVHHFCMLIGYGCDAICPYLAYETIQEMIEEGFANEGIDFDKALHNYLYALDKGILKVISKMGISTLQSYRGAQIFTAIGLSTPLIDKYFTGTVSTIEGITLDDIAAESLARHQQAFPPVKARGYDGLDIGGVYHWRRGGERHLYNPETIALVRHAVRGSSYKMFKEYTRVIDDQSRHLFTLRGLIELHKTRESVPLAEVEPVSAIVKRFATGAMSFGSISKEAHENLAIAMNRLGGRSNTGEGGEDPARFTPDENGDWRRSSIKQCASGRFGADTNYLINADEIQIKIAQGAKPGEGGQLPGHKVDKIIARIRNSMPGVGLISPPPHHDIYSIEDLSQLIHDLKNVNPHARISVKLVASDGVGTVAAGVAKAKADVVLIAGHDGGTGASPLTSIKHTGTPWELGLSETQQVLVANGLRSRIIVQTDGQLKTGRDVAIATLLGAEEFGFATAALVAEGCIMMRKCHLNTCPVGVATQDPELRKRFEGKPEHVINFMHYIAEELREIMAELGYRTIAEMVGRTENLKQRKTDNPKARGLNFDRILFKPEEAGQTELLCKTIGQDHELEKSLDQKLIRLVIPSLKKKRPVNVGLTIVNTNRSVGPLLSGEIVRHFGERSLSDDMVICRFEGSAGQSFGAWLCDGVTYYLEGDANDYVGKGLSGGRIIIHPPKDATFETSKNIIIGNVCMYGAIRGEMFANGMAGERFAIRNSGAKAVVEGVGDHGCEYMTGGMVIVLGPTGRNFAAGMSGGIAYVYNEDGEFQKRCNHEMIELEEVVAHRDQIVLKGIIERHLQYTRSEKAQLILSEWSKSLKMFVKVFPTEYRKALEVMEQEQLAENVRAEGVSAGR